MVIQKEFDILIEEIRKLKESVDDFKIEVKTLLQAHSFYHAQEKIDFDKIVLCNNVVELPEADISDMPKGVKVKQPQNKILKKLK